MYKKKPGDLPGPYFECLKVLNFCKQDPATFCKVEITKKVKPIIYNLLHEFKYS